MRELTTKQKRILDRWIKQNLKEIEDGICFFDLSKCALFSYDLLVELEKINDTEILTQNINAYVSEKGQELLSRKAQV
jgi:hypothetical protein